MSATLTPYVSYEVQQALKPAGLDGLSDKLLDQHWKLYEGYVTNTNALNKAIREAADAGAELNKAVTAEQIRRLGFEYNGMVLHEYYFGALKKGTQAPASSAALAKRFEEDYGGFDKWKKVFGDIGKLRGIGWVITSLDPASQRLNTFWVSDHEVGNIASFLPVVVMDMWEHAYVTDYGASAAGRAEYLGVYFKNLDWDATAYRLDVATKMAKIGSRYNKA